MARDNHLRHDTSERPATAGRFAVLRVLSPITIAAIVAILAATFVGVYELSVMGSAKKPAKSAFLTSALGVPQRSASPTRTRTFGSRATRTATVRSLRT